MYDRGAVVNSVTCDGASVNLTMCKHLGVNFTMDPAMKPYFEHGRTRENVYVLPDPCQMLKLGRNTVGDLNSLYDEDEQTISFRYIQNHHNVQTAEGLSLPIRSLNGMLSTRRIL